MSYGMAVYAPAAGTIVHAANDVPENSYEGEKVVYPTLPENVDPIGLGNHVTIDQHFRSHEAGKRGSKERRPRRSGSEDWCHRLFWRHIPPPLALHGMCTDLSEHRFKIGMHYEVMDGINERTSRGLPSYFSGFMRVLGTKEKTVSRGQIDSGDILEYSPGEGKR